VDNHGLNRHFRDVSRVGTIEFRTENLWKVVINEHFVLSSSVAGSVFIG